MRTTIVSAATLGLIATAYGIDTQCMTSDVCYSLSIPSSTVSSGNGDIYIQISGPTTYSWIGVGQGTQMAEAEIMVIYANTVGDNVTLSPRIATGQSQPSYNSVAQMSLLAGSGISNGVMTANILCSSCSSWNGGSMDFSSSTTSWIYGFKSGSELNSNSLSATIQQHDSDGYGTFQFGSTAQGGSDSNPFLSSSNSSAACTTSASQDAVSDSSAGITSITPTVTYATITATVTQTQKNGGNNNNSDNNNNNNDNNSKNGSKANQTQTARARSLQRGVPMARRGETAEMIVKRQTSSDCNATDSSSSDSSSSSNSQNSTSNSTSKRTMVITAHAVLACLAFAFFFPIGGILIRVAHFNGTLWVHAGLQIAAYLLNTAAVGMGIWITQNPNFGELQNQHPIIGLFLFALLLFQAPVGWIHHVGYKKYGRRTFWSYIHLWIGRVAITLGIINAGFGFILSGTTGSGPIAYAVVAAIIWVAYVLAVLYGERQRSRRLAKSVSPVQHPRISVRRDVIVEDDEQGLNRPTSMAMRMRPSQDRHPRHSEIPMPSLSYYEGGSLRSHPARI